MDSFYTPSKIIDITIQNGIKKVKKENVLKHCLVFLPVCSSPLPLIPAQWLCIASQARDLPGFLAEQFSPSA